MKYTQREYIKAADSAIAGQIANHISKSLPNLVNCNQNAYTYLAVPFDTMDRTRRK